MKRAEVPPGRILGAFSAHSRRISESLLYASVRFHTLQYASIHLLCTFHTLQYACLQSTRPAACFLSLVIRASSAVFYCSSLALSYIDSVAINGSNLIALFSAKDSTSTSAINCKCPKLKKSSLPQLPHPSGCTAKITSHTISTHEQGYPHRRPCALRSPSPPVTT